MPVPYCWPPALPDHARPPPPLVAAGRWTTTAAPRRLRLPKNAAEIDSLNAIISKYKPSEADVRGERRPVLSRSSVFFCCSPGRRSSQHSTADRHQHTSAYCFRTIVTVSPVPPPPSSHRQRCSCGAILTTSSSGRVDCNCRSRFLVGGRHHGRIYWWRHQRPCGIPLIIATRSSQQ